MLNIKHLQRGGYVIPNVCYVEESDGFIMKPYVEPEKELITFTIDGTRYQAEEGMTWGEWVDSEYNTGNFIIDEDTDALFDTIRLRHPTRGGMLIIYTTEIISGYSYI